MATVFGKQNVTAAIYVAADVKHMFTVVFATVQCKPCMQEDTQDVKILASLMGEVQLLLLFMVHV